MELLELTIEERVVAQMVLVLAACAAMSVVLCWICEQIDPDELEEKRWRK